MAATQATLPTFDVLGAKPPADVDAKSTAAEWFQRFAQSVEQGDVDGILGLFVDDGYWRDMLAMTWSFRTFRGKNDVHKFLSDTLPEARLTKLKLRDDYVAYEQPYPDLAWIQGLFSFETSIGFGSAVFRLVYLPDGAWKAHTVYTNLEDLKGYPEQIGPLRNDKPNHGKWPEQRNREINFLDSEPAVVIVGAGQSGLEVAARLRYLNVPTLVVDKQARIGDQWRGRYEALCLHDSVWYDHLPYIPFPASWPVWTPAPKLADWLESYASSLELNVWMGVTVESVKQTGSGWEVAIKRSTGELRVFKPRHIVWALGLAGGVPNMPKYPGMEEFQGTIVHSTAFKSARDNIGKKVVIIGACTSGHDVAYDHAVHDVDVTLYQRSSTYIMSAKHGIPAFLPVYVEGGPPTDIADRITASYPHNFEKVFHPRITQDVAKADHELLEGLKKRGFKLNWGLEGSGFPLLAWSRGGGYYFDAGASQLIIDGKIKIKNDSKLASFTKTGLKFENGSEFPADVVIFATGFGDGLEPVRKICGPEFTSKIGQVWGLNAEGEITGVWADCGVPNMYFMMGNLALCRFHSKHLALQIKAVEEGIMGKRYTT